MDDVGGLSGFARFLYDVYEGEDRNERATLLQWAKSLGWNPAKRQLLNSFSKIFGENKPEN